MSLLLPFNGQKNCLSDISGSKHHIIVRAKTQSFHSKDGMKIFNTAVSDNEFLPSTCSSYEFFLSLLAVISCIHN
jgi:hypothetical protein